MSHIHRVSVLEPFQEGIITVRVPSSTRNLTISAAFKNSDLVKKGFQFWDIDYHLWWSVEDSRDKIFNKQTVQNFVHTSKIKQDILITSLVGDISTAQRFSLQTNSHAKPNIKTKDTVYVIETYEEGGEERSSSDTKTVDAYVSTLN